MADPGDILCNLLAVIHRWLVHIVRGCIQDWWSNLIPEFHQTWQRHRFLRLLLYYHLVVLHLELLGCFLRCGAVEVDLLGNTVWNHLAGTRKELLTLIDLIRLDIGVLQALRWLQHSVILFVNFDLWVWNVWRLFTLVFHWIIAFNRWVPWHDDLRGMYLSFFRLLLRVELHFIVIAFASSYYDQATFWTLIVSIKWHLVCLWVQFGTGRDRSFFGCIEGLKSIRISG